MQCHRTQPAHRLSNSSLLDSFFLFVILFHRIFYSFYQDYIVICYFSSDICHNMLWLLLLIIAFYTQLNTISENQIFDRTQNTCCKMINCRIRATAYHLNILKRGWSKLILVLIKSYMKRFFTHTRFLCQCFRVSMFLVSMFPAFRSITISSRKTLRLCHCEVNIEECRRVTVINCNCISVCSHLEIDIRHDSEGFLLANR